MCHVGNAVGACALCPADICDLASPCACSCRLQTVETELAAREREILQLREQLQREIQSEAQHAAGQAAELAGERAALQKQTTALEQEKDEYRKWKQETKDELQKQLKVCRTSDVHSAWQDCCPACLLKCQVIQRRLSAYRVLLISVLQVLCERHSWQPAFSLHTRAHCALLLLDFAGARDLVDRSSAST